MGKKKVEMHNPTQRKNAWEILKYRWQYYSTDFTTNQISMNIKGIKEDTREPTSE
jgi:sulfur relay (sulfurtransferase) DsrC/TusE family protein